MAPKELLLRRESHYLEGRRLNLGRSLECQVLGNGRMWLLKILQDDGTFPINDKAHARNALARAHFAKNPNAIRAKVHAKYPEIGKTKKAK